MVGLQELIQEEIFKICMRKPHLSESLVSSGLLNSITIIDLVVSIEQKTARRIPQHVVTAANFETIERILALIHSLDKK